MHVSYAHINFTFFSFCLIVSALGILGNLVYLWVTTVKKNRRKHTDITLLTCCIVKILTGGIFIMRSITIKKFTDVEVPTMIYNILDWFELCFDCIFIWSILILNIFRYLLLRELDNLQDHGIRRRQSKKCLIAAIVVIVLTSLVFRFIFECCNVTQRALIVQILDALIKKMPLCTTVIFQYVTFSKIITLLKRNNRIKPSSNRRRDVSDESNSRVLLKQALYSQSYQAIFYLFPSLVLFVLELLLTNCEKMSHTAHETYIMGKILLVLFNPLTAGILLQPRRDFLLSFLGSAHCSNKKVSQQRHQNTTGLNREMEIQTINSTFVSMLSLNLRQKGQDGHHEYIQELKECLNNSSISLNNHNNRDNHDTDFHEQDVHTEILFQDSFKTRLPYDLKIDDDANTLQKNDQTRVYSYTHRKSIDLSMMSLNSETSVFHSHTDLSSCRKFVDIGTRRKSFMQSLQRSVDENSNFSGSCIMSLLSTSSYAEVLSFC